MQIQTLLIAFVGLVAAQGSVCFDDFDCILAGGKCVKKGLLGSCSGKAGSATTVSAAPQATTGSICFDAGDCLLAGGGQCVRGKGDTILGHCAKKN